MRQFWSIVLALAIGFSGAIFFSHLSYSSIVPTPTSTDEKASFLIVEVEENNAVEVDGVRFENIIEGRIFPIPQEGSDNYTPVTISLKITNNSSTPKRFTRFDNLFPEIRLQDNQLVPWNFYRSWTIPPTREDCPIVLPKQTISFEMNFKLLWREGDLQLEAEGGFGGKWTFSNLQSGEYWMRLIYAHLPSPPNSESPSIFTIFDPETRRSVIISDLWEGGANPPFLKIQLATIKH